MAPKISRQITALTDDMLSAQNNQTGVNTIRSEISMDGMTGFDLWQAGIRDVSTPSIFVDANQTVTLHFDGVFRGCQIEDIASFHVLESV